MNATWHEQMRRWRIFESWETKRLRSTSTDYAARAGHLRVPDIVDFYRSCLHRARRDERT
jgi:hypothetical protein